MPRLPTPGGDNGNWGEILNEYLSVSHAPDGSLQSDLIGDAQLKADSVGTNQLQNEAVTRIKLSAGIKDDLDSKLENITGYIASGSNVTMTGLGTLASPYQISSTDSGGNVTGASTSNDNALARFDGTSGKTIQTAEIYVDDAGKLGLGTSSPTHTVTLPSSSTGISLYNTADQTTNYERGRMYWSSNLLTIASENAGTGAARNIRLTASGSQLDIGATGSTSGFVFTRGNTSLTTIVQIGSTFNSTSTTQYGLQVAPTISQSGTAAYTALLVNPSESTVGSGNRLLADFQNSGTTKFSVTQNGTLYSAMGLGVGTALSGGYSFTATNPTELVSTSPIGYETKIYGAGGQNVFKRANGSLGSEAALVSGDTMGALSFRGWDGSSYTGSKAFIIGSAAENWSTSATGTNVTIQTTPNGSTTMRNVAVLTHAGQLQLPVQSVSAGILFGGDTGLYRNGGSYLRTDALFYATNYATAVAVRTGAISLGATNANVNLCNATTAAFTVTLPSAASLSGLMFIIKKTDATANVVTVATTSSQTIDGATTYALATQNKFVHLVSDGANWAIVGAN